MEFNATVTFENNKVEAQQNTQVREENREQVKALLLEAMGLLIRGDEVTLDEAKALLSEVKHETR